MKSLYEITTTHQEIINKIEYMEGELTPEVEKMLELSEHNLEVKSLAYLEVISRKNSFNGMIDEEIKRLQTLKKRNSNIVTRLKDNLLNAVKTFGGFDVGTQSFSTRKSTSVEVLDVNSLPEEFKTLKLTESANKVLLKEAIKQGQEIKGVRLVENTNLKIN
tara:strand:+ start:130 stop:615 length:486 start_codon:yes stop_codon:yes gene_type:complete